jgi:hypothetical protein
MSHYLIRNKSTSRIRIPELGIDLLSRNQTAVVSKRDWETCQAANPFKPMVSITAINNVPIYPLSAPVITDKLSYSTKPAEAIYQSLESVPMQVVVQVDSKMVESESIKILDKLNELIDSIKDLANRPVQMNSGSVVTSVANSISSVPDFIPKTIIPDAQVQNLKSKFESQDRPDLDETSNALKRLRGKK